MSEKQDLLEVRRARLKKAHGGLEAFVTIVEGAITLIGGMRTLFDILRPPPASKKKEDKSKVSDEQS